MSLADMNVVMGRISKIYKDKDYITTRTYLSEQDLSKGILHIVVIRRDWSGFRFEGMDPFHHEAMAFPWLKRDELNIYNIEQGMDQINRLSDWSAIMQVNSTKVLGKSEVDVKASDSDISLHRFRLTIMDRVN